MLLIIWLLWPISGKNLIIINIIFTITLQMAATGGSTSTAALKEKWQWQWQWQLLGSLQLPSPREGMHVLDLQPTSAVGLLVVIRQAVLWRPNLLHWVRQLAWSKERACTRGPVPPSPCVAIQLSHWRGFMVEDFGHWPWFDSQPCMALNLNQYVYGTKNNIGFSNCKPILSREAGWLWIYMKAGFGVSLN